MAARIGVRRTVVVVVLAAAACGAGCGDDGDATPPAKPTPPKPAAGGTEVKNLLAEKLHIEDRVGCPIPDRPSDAKGGRCDPKAPDCAEHLYCLQLAQGSYCEPCPERDGIRHAFKERDFAEAQNRDPFQSFLLPQIPVGKPTDVQIDVTKKCLREDQMVATGYSYADLRLVGVVAQGTLRKVLMMGGPLGYIIKRGDCVGKEKAVVKDIGTGYITFQVEPDATAMNTRTPAEFSVQLNPRQLMVNDPSELPSPAPRTTITPVVPPAAVLPPRAAPAAAGSAGGGAAPIVEAPPAPAKQP